jgi:phospholipid/cholesterol/gamma-HCH transport system substrate-binding protein
MKRSRAAEFRVGLFVAAALLTGMALAFVIGNQQNIFKRKNEYVALFDSVDGLSEGSSVRIAGVNVGVVRSVELTEDGTTRVTVGVVEDAVHLVRRDSVASIGNQGLLGDKLVDITPGSGELLPEGETLQTENAVGIGEYVGQLGVIISEVEQTARNLRIATGPLAEEQFASDLTETTSNLAVITRMAANEDGALAHLLTDEESAQRLDRSLANIDTASRELATAARAVRHIAQEVERGDGTAHELIYGDQGTRLVTNLADATGEIAASLNEIREGEGLIHELIYEESGGELMANLSAMSGDLRAVTADIRAGRGTIGALLTDPSIYEDIKRLVGNLERNEILRALVRYSIRQDEPQEAAEVDEVDE